jgi:hypothetical protein
MSNPLEGFNGIQRAAHIAQQAVAVGERLLHLGPVSRLISPPDVSACAVHG